MDPVKRKQTASRNLIRLRYPRISEDVTKRDPRDVCRHVCDDDRGGELCIRGDGARHRAEPQTVERDSAGTVASHRHEGNLRKVKKSEIFNTPM